MSVAHDHDHDHPHADPENPWAGQGSVLLDIGGDVGALVVQMPEQMTGVEIEIRPADSVPVGGHHPHVAVVARPVGSRLVPTLVYPELTAGSYELYEKGTNAVEMTAVVAGGVVTETTWPG